MTSWLCAHAIRFPELVGLQNKSDVLTRRSIINSTTLVGRRLDWRRGRGRGRESALSWLELGVLKRLVKK